MAASLNNLPIGRNEDTHPIWLSMGITYEGATESGLVDNVNSLTLETEYNSLTINMTQRRAFYALTQLAQVLWLHGCLADPLEKLVCEIYQQTKTAYQWGYKDAGVVEERVHQHISAGDDRTVNEIRKEVIERYGKHLHYNGIDPAALGRNDIEQLVRRAGYDWDKLEEYIQVDLQDDWEWTKISDDEAVMRIRSLLSDIAPETKIELW